MKLDYLILNLLMFYVFYHSGKLISGGRKYWPNAWKCIAMFSFMMGFRFNRGNDYLLYKVSFANRDDFETNPMFGMVNHILATIGFNQYSCFMAYALVFSICAMIFLEEYKKNAKYVFPLFLCGYLILEENMIRQAFSYSFIFLMLKYLSHLNPRGIRPCIDLYKVIFFSFLTVSLHSGNIITIGVILLVYFFLNKPINSLISIPIFLACTFVLPKIFNFDWLQGILSFAADNNKLASSYVENSEKWFSASGMEDKYEKNPIALALQVLGVSYIMYASTKVNYKNNPNLPKLFFVFVNVCWIGYCIEGIFYNLEILKRIGTVICTLGVFAVAYIFPGTRNSNNKILLYGRFTSIWFCYFYIKHIIEWAIIGGLFMWDTPYSFFD